MLCYKHRGDYLIHDTLWSSLELLSGTNITIDWLNLSMSIPEI